ncbi:MAG: homoserine dehydrogenase [Clostridia bacterium]|nr:homoserine dehydrogenase [Clostridia bacterium]
MLGSLNIGLLGLGTVGGGVFQLLQQNSDVITQKLGRPLNICRILERNMDRVRQLGVDPGLVTSDPGIVLNDPDIDIIIEVIGGVELAREFILQALSNGKSVVTANKDLLALHGKELFEAAAAHNCDLFFEASVGGGIPIIRPLKESLAANRICQVMGIVNGTTNYILTKMSREGRDFDEVLKEAQELGYAESDPSSDIEGDDAARKMAILASIAFGSRVTYPEVYREGISRLSVQDIKYASNLGYAVKLLGIAREDEQGVEVRVHPALLPLEHPLAAVNDVFNAIFVEGDAVGDTMFYGRGAGAMPTASAIIGDVIEAARNRQHRDCIRSSCTCFYNKPLKPMGEVISKYYLRLIVADRPGVLAAIAGVFGARGVSIASVIQERTIGDLAELVLITHLVREQNLQDALKALADLPVVNEIASMIRVEGGPSN